MAILSEFVDEEPQDVGTLLNNLSIPSDFARHEILDDKDTIARLVEWKANAFNALKDLRGLLENKRHEIPTSDLIYTCASFQGDGDWISEDMRALSYGKPVVYAITVK
jgi:flagellar biosynthesis regulator FlbT